MNRTRDRIIGTLAVALISAALVPGGSFAYTDLRSPDARDAALASQARDYTDLRSPDARDAALASHAHEYTDLRSPDARDVGRPQTSPSPTPTGTDWRDVGIVASGVLMLIGLGGFVLFTRRRGGVRKPQATVVSS